jgi:hypothetical protein
MAAQGWRMQVAFHYFATAQDLVEIYADIEAEAPVRIVHEHDIPGSEKQYFLSFTQIPGVANGGTLTRCLPSFLAFPFEIEPELTEIDAMERRLACMDRRDNPDAVEIKPPSLLFADGFERPELNAGNVSFFTRADYVGEPNPTALARALASRVRKAIRRRSCLMFAQGKTRIYIARRALEMARRKEISLACGWEVWSPAECDDDAERLERLKLPKSAFHSAVRRTERSHNVTPMRKFRLRTVEFNEPDNPDQLFVAAYDDLSSIFDAACHVDDLNYSRLGPPRFRSICQSADGLPGLGASSLRHEIESGIIAWRDKAADYSRVCEAAPTARPNGCIAAIYASPTALVRVISMPCAKPSGGGMWTPFRRRVCLSTFRCCRKPKRLSMRASCWMPHCCRVTSCVIASAKIQALSWHFRTSPAPNPVRQ